MNTMEYQTYTIENDMGDADLTVYQLFSGVELVYSSVHTDAYDLGNLKEELLDSLIEIHHCREGRVEQVYGDEVFYLMPGDLALAIRRETNRSYSFPTHHYHGCTIMIDTKRAPKCFSTFLEDVQVQPMEIVSKLCRDRNSFYIRKQEYVEHIFSELYTVPEHLKKGYLKVKVLELLLILSTVDPEENVAPKVAVPKAQMLLAKRCAEHLTQRMNQHITIPELAKEFNVSETSLKNAFKAVYGMPIYSYVRLQKMHMASQQLIHSDLAVADIAYDLGYKNTSKFADAFRRIMGETPCEFRENHQR